MTFRNDIHGLRGLAILLVVAYHVHLPQLSGGFVGVDVFFVLSGFLISGLLFKELSTTGGISLTEFYARRARRLLPASAVVLIATTLAALLFLSPLEQLNVSASALTTALYVSNLFFIRESTDYLAAPPEVNPFLHTWSLSVEEQFYLVWPTIILLFFKVLKERRLVAGAIGVSAVLSFAASMWLTTFAQPWAFFGSPARVWEFAIGALAAAVPVTIQRGRRTLCEASTAAGLVMIVAAGVLFDRRTTFPGLAALLPVAGTALVLACGHESKIVSGLLRTRPMQWFGDVSYVWYLWHWPVLVFALAVAPRLDLGGRIMFGLLSLAIAAVTRSLLEDRARFSPTLVARPALTLVLAAILTLASVTGTGLWRIGARQASLSDAQVRFSQARDDNPVLYADGCHLNYENVVSPDCVFGEAQSPTTVVLFGDSHAAHWFPAIERLATEEGWRLVSLTKSACPSIDIGLRDARLGRRYVECETWRRSSLARIEALRPSLVVLTNSSEYVQASPLDAANPREPVSAGGAPAIAETTADWLAGLRRTLRTLDGFGLHTVILRDSPRPGFDAPTCLARQTWRPALYPEGCRFARNQGVRPDIARAEEMAALESRGASIVDVSSDICDGEVCDTVRGEMVIYRDHHHLTARFSATLAPALAAQLKHGW